MSGIWFGAEEAGYVGLTWRILAAPTALIGVAVSSVFLGELARRSQDDPAESARIYSIALRRLLPIGLAIIVLPVVFGPWAFALFLGPEWAEAGQVARIVAPAIGLSFIAGPLRQVLVVFERHRMTLTLDAVRVVLTLGLGLAVYEQTGDFLKTMAGFSLALTLTYALEIAATWVTARRGPRRREDISVAQTASENPFEEELD